MNQLTNLVRHTANNFLAQLFFYFFLDTESDDDSSDISKVLEPVSQPGRDCFNFNRIRSIINYFITHFNKSRILGDLGMKKDEISETEEELDKLFYQFSKIKKAEVLNLSTKKRFPC